MNVRLLAPAQAELDEAISWYSAQAPGLGDGFLVEVLRSIQLIQRHPAGWQPLTPGIRRCACGVFHTAWSTPSRQTWC
jgi:hypothetical protein